MNVFIITEGNITVGFGHISRCISLYQAFVEKNITPCLIIKGDDSIKNILGDTKYCLIDWLTKIEDLLLKIKGADIIIIDSYLVDYAELLKISLCAKVVVYIDDTNRINYPPGILINSLIHAKEINYYTNQNKKYILGPEYCMLRKEFWNIPKKKQKEEIGTVLVTFGGNDMRDLTPKILKILKNRYPNIKKTVIIGKGFQNIKRIKTFEDKATELLFFPLTIEIINAMLQSDFAITAGGQTLYELACVGVPAITISVAENQEENSKQFSKLGLNSYVGLWNDENLSKNILNSIEKLKSLEVRHKMVNLGYNIIKPDGSRRIIDYLLKI